MNMREEAGGGAEEIQHALLSESQELLPQPEFMRRAYEVGLRQVTFGRTEFTHLIRVQVTRALIVDPLFA
jgi:hypothetical protein